MKTKNIFSLISLTLALLLLLCACGETVTVLSASMDDDGNLILTMSDGTTQNVGKVKGEQGVQGAQGVQGEKGDKGDQGDAATDENPQGLDFYPLTDGTYGVKAGKALYLERIEIPATYQGKAVTQILPMAFGDPDASNTTLKEIIIPNSITTIGISAFSGCDALTSVTIPDSVTTIDNYAFSGCDALTSITIPDSVTTIGNNAFSNCDALTSITIPNSVTTIGGRAFNGCDALAKVTFANPNGWSVRHTQHLNHTYNVDVSDPYTAATLLTDTYILWQFYRN